jgi:hypothetical protein
VLPKRCLSGNTYDRGIEDMLEIKIDNNIREPLEPHSERYYQGPVAKPSQFAPGRYEIFILLNKASHVFAMRKRGLPGYPDPLYFTMFSTALGAVSLFINLL